MSQEQPYDYGDAITPQQIRERQAATPQGVPAATGYYPNVRGNLAAGPIGTYQVYDDQIHDGVVVGWLNGTEDVDQHDWVDVTATWTPPAGVDRPPGVHDPLPDGPPPPSLRDLSLHYRKWAGQSQTRLLDAPGVQFKDVGTQDGISGVYLQDVQRTLAAYAPVEPGGEMPDTLRWLPPGPAHGWTVRPAQTSTEETLTKLADLAQQQPGHQELLANSTYAGQSYSTQTAHLAPGSSGSTQSRRPRG